jgi:hypothetical protein
VLDTQAAAEFVDCEFTGNEGTGLSQPTCRRPNPADCFKPLCDYLLFTTYITSRLLAHTSYEYYERLTLCFTHRKPGEARPRILATRTSATWARAALFSWTAVRCSWRGVRAFPNSKSRLPVCPYKTDTLSFTIR